MNVEAKINGERKGDDMDKWRGRKLSGREEQEIGIKMKLKYVFLLSLVRFCPFKCRGKTGIWAFIV